MTKFYEIDFIEAGEKSSGDAITLRYQDDDGVEYVHVVDGGYTKDGDKIVSHIEEYYGKPPLIDHVVLTHPDGDHAAGLKIVLETYDVGVLWMNRPWNHIDDLLPRFDYAYTEQGLRQRLRKDFPNVAALEDIAEERGIEIRDALQGDKIGWFFVLAPSYERYLDLVVESEKTPEPQREAAIAGRLFERVVTFVKSLAAGWGEENLKGETEGTSNENESSVVQFANLCDKKILLTGDVGVKGLEEAYDYAVALGVELPGIDKFDVPHHGSRRNVSSGILDKWLGEKLPAEPDRGRFSAIISANRNDPDHPRKATVRALVHRGARVVQPNGTLCAYGGDAPDRGWSSAEPLDYPTDMEE